MNSPSVPRRIVCLTPETVDVLYRLGAGARIVGVSRFTRTPPEARSKPFVSAFTTIDFDKIVGLAPDLVIGFSDLQADAARELCRRGLQVLITNQRALAETLDAITLLANLIGNPSGGAKLIAELRERLEMAQAQVREPRPRVYFEEWPDPPISGIGWVSELIHAAGGADIFAEKAKLRSAGQRIVSFEEVAAAQPEIIIASWCGKRADLAAIRSRPGWEQTPAVRYGRVFELDSDYCLQPGPVLFEEALPRLQAMIQSSHHISS